MAKRTGKRVIHIPQRTCVGCRKIFPKRSLIRIVRTPNGVKVDPSGKAKGRGAYLHNNRSCWEQGLKGSLAHALKANFSDQDLENLRIYMVSLQEVEISTEET